MLAFHCIFSVHIATLDREKFQKFRRKNLQPKAAVLAIIDFVNDYKNEIDFLALAPLTNLALALNIDASLGDKLNVCTKIITLEIKNINFSL